jgi:glycosyltransferase involved in cell wall biosynthesis
MKILLVSNFFPPTHNAGTEKRTLGYALQLKGLGYDPQVVCAGNWDVGPNYWNGFTDEVYQDIPVRRVDLNWKLAQDPNQYLYRNPIIAEHFDNWVDKWKPDVVHVTSCYTVSASIIQKAKDLELPTVLTLTDYWFICPKNTLLRSNGCLCNGLTSNFDCLDCLLLDKNKIYQKIRNFIPSALLVKSLESISENPNISKFRGLRGMALNIGDRKKYLSLVIDLPDAVIAPSQYLADIFKNSGISRPIRVIKSGHDLSWIRSNNDRDKSEKLRFGYIGQILPIKGLQNMISAFALNDGSRDCELLIYGDYDQDITYTSKLTAQIKQIGKDISLCGRFPHDQLGEILVGIDMLIVPSLWHENNPRVIQEAFASKTPVIASNVGGISEFVKHEVNGFLFERGNQLDLFKQISKVIDHPDIITQLQNGIEPVKTIKSEVDEINNIYQEMINSKTVKN